MKLLRRHIPLLASVLVLLALYAAAAAYYGDRGFHTAQVFFNLLGDNAVVGIAAVGATFVILSGGIDLSVGALMSASSVLIAVLIADYHWPPSAAFPAAVAAGTGFGLAMGALIHFTGIRPFIVTLAGMFFARGVGFRIHLESIAITDPRHVAIASFGIPFAPGARLTIAAIVFLAVVAVGAYVAVMTRFGRNVYALGGNEEAALLMGLPVGRTKIAVYGVAGFCASLAGAVLTLYLSAGSHIEGVGMELDVIAAVVVGGTLITGGVGSVLGTLVGVLIIGIILNVMTFESLSSGLTKLAIGALLFLFVLLQRLLTRRTAHAPA